MTLCFVFWYVLWVLYIARDFKTRTKRFRYKVWFISCCSNWFLKERIYCCALLFYTCDLQGRGKNSVCTDCIIPDNKIGDSTGEHPIWLDLGKIQSTQVQIQTDIQDLVTISLWRSFSLPLVILADKVSNLSYCSNYFLCFSSGVHSL